MRLITLQEIKSKLDLDKAIALQERGFQLYSEGKVTVPPVGYMYLGQKDCEVHVKYGWIKGDETFAVKIAGAHPDSPSKGNGVILVFDVKTGEPKILLQDEGHLTNLRTAIAGLIAAKTLAPSKITGIGILGTGVQARLQVQLLKRQTDCRNLWVWGRNQSRVNKYIQEMSEAGFDVKQAKSPKEICEQCNLIITTTAAREPLISVCDIRPGIHITAVGADAPGKQELDPNIFAMANRCVVDSRSQCLDHGETFHSYQQGLIAEAKLVELGEVIASPSLRRANDNEITIADLTGVSVQDIQISKECLF